MEDEGESNEPTYSHQDFQKRLKKKNDPVLKTLSLCLASISHCLNDLMV